MKWLWVIIFVISSTAGDVFSAKGMAERGEIRDFRPREIATVVRYIGTHFTVLAGIAANAVAF